MTKAVNYVVITPKVGVITRNYVTRNLCDYLRVIDYAHDLLAQRSKAAEVRAPLIRESRVRASQTGHFGHFYLEARVRASQTGRSF